MAAQPEPSLILSFEEARHVVEAHAAAAAVRGVIRAACEWLLRRRELALSRPVLPTALCFPGSWVSYVSLSPPPTIVSEIPPPPPCPQITRRREGTGMPWARIRG